MERAPHKVFSNCPKDSYYPRCPNCKSLIENGECPLGTRSAKAISNPILYQTGCSEDLPLEKINEIVENGLSGRYAKDIYPELKRKRILRGRK